MKKTILMLASGLSMLLCACDKTLSDTFGASVSNEGCVLNVNFDDGADIATKAVGVTEENESTIQNVQIFVFRSDEGGTLDACGYRQLDGQDFSNMSLNCTTGSREVWAIVNSAVDYTKDASVGSKDALLAKSASLADCAPDKLLMIGSLPPQTIGAGSKDVTVPVKRACASVVLKSITNDIQAPVYQSSGRFKIKDIYLLNVPARINIAGTVKASSLAEGDWWAKMGVEKKSLIYDGRTESLLEYGSKYETRHVFYTFPNNCEPKSGSPWVARATRLVIEASYNDGKVWHDCYYPITLYDSVHKTGLDANKRYEVNLTIKRPGSTNPDKPVEFNTMLGHIEILDWETGTTYTETI